MTDPNRFDGVFTAMVTPFDARGAIDWDAFDRFVDWQLDSGIAGLVPVGTTGEAATLSEAEAARLIERTVRRAEGRAYVLAGAGSNDTAKAVAATKRAFDAGADGVLHITPYYNKPGQEGLCAHFSAVAEAASGDVMLYSVPGRTAIAIEPETAARLAGAHSNIVAIKEAGGDPARATRLRAACGRGFVVHCGDDGLALAFYALGARGVTSVLSNVRPAECVTLFNAWASGDREGALEWHERLAAAAAAMFVESSPGPAKFVLEREGRMNGRLRLPLVPTSAAG
ncbi:MAG: 4-hydroxy-tetrahydrodipicolinate synthase, partial [Rhizobiaceae bacterium]